MKELYTALLACKKQLGTKIHVDAQGQYGSYASLEQVLDKIEPVAQAHGLLILQGVRTNVETTITPVLVTQVIHAETDTEVTWDYLLLSDKPGPQGLGAAETYARRRSLMSIFGLATEGDPDSTQQTQPRPQAQPYRPPAGQGNAHTPQPAKPGAYSNTVDHLMRKLIPVGKKFSGMTYGQVPLKDLINYAEWMQGAAAKEGKEPSKYAQEFFSDVQTLQSDAEGTGFATVSDDERVPF